MSTKLNGELDTLKVDSQEVMGLLKIFKEGVIALDLETTGLSPLTDRIIEISAVKITPSNNSFNLEVFDELINPKIEIPQTTIDIHGITNQMIKDCDDISKVLPRFHLFMGNLPIIAHNAIFDIGFLVFDMHQFKLPLPSVNVYCSCRLARQAFKELKGHGLANLTKELSIDLKNHHRALDDALACLKVFLKSLEAKSITDKEGLNYAKVLDLKEFQENFEYEIPPHLVDLKKYLEKQTPIMIRYKGGSHGKGYRPIRPISFLPMPSGNILYAHCLITDLYKSFALKKIRDFKESSNQEIESFLKEYK